MKFRVLLALLLMGCHRDKPNRWLMEYHPTTAEERDKVAKPVSTP